MSFMQAFEDFKDDHPDSEVLRNMRERCAENDEDMLFADGFDGALIGHATICHSTVALYDRAKCIEILIGEGMSHEDAEEHFSFNVEGSHVGTHTPAFATLLRRS